MKEAFIDPSVPRPPNSETETLTGAVPDKTLNYLRLIHGVVLGASFMAFYPVGVIIIHRTDLKDAFRYHWIMQVSLTAATFLTISALFYHSSNSVNVR